MTSVKHTLFDRTTLAVFGRGLTEEEAGQYTIDKVQERDRKSLALLSDDDFERLARETETAPLLLDLLYSCAGEMHHHKPAEHAEK